MSGAPEGLKRYSLKEWLDDYELRAEKRSSDIYPADDVDRLVAAMTNERARAITKLVEQIAAKDAEIARLKVDLDVSKVALASAKTEIAQFRERLSQVEAAGKEYIERTDPLLERMEEISDENHQLRERKRVQVWEQPWSTP